MKTLDLIGISSVSAPGGQQAGDTGIPVLLTSKYSRVSRLALNLAEPLQLQEDDSFRFSIQFTPDTNVEFDILAGDSCLPEIHLENQNGEIYTFKRGNLKDFLQIKKMNSLQDATLPLGAFIYHTHLRSNAPKSGVFFSTPLKKICFDFLNPPSGEACATIREIVIQETEKALPAVFSFINISPSNKFTDQPVFLSETHKASLRVTAKDVLHALSGDSANLRIKPADPGNPHGLEVPVRDTPAYCELQLPAFGEHLMKAELTAGGKVIARNNFTAVRMYPCPAISKSKLGLSEGASFAEARAVGGEYIRLVLPLQRITCRNGAFRFHGGRDVTPLIRNTPGKWVVAFKTMPAFLQKDAEHAHRLGPKDPAMYREMLQWLVPQLLDAGVHAFEGWNEANVIHEWCDTMDALCGMQKALYETVKAHGPEAKVLSPSSTSWDFDYFQRLEEAGVLTYADALAVHGYTYTPEKAAAYFDQLEEFMRQSRGRAKSAFITELGFRTPAFSNFEQASYFTLFTLEAFFREKIDSIIWFRYQNPLPESFSAYDQNASTGYAMVGNSGLYARSSLAAFRFLDTLLSQSSPESTYQDGQTKIFNGRYLHGHFTAAYAENGDFGTSLIHSNLYDIFGNRISHSQLKTHKVVLATEHPVAI